MNFAEYICGAGFRRADGARLLIDGSETLPVALCNPSAVTVEVAAGASAKILISHAWQSHSEIEFLMGEGARAEVVEWFDGGESTLRVRQSGGSSFAMTAVVTGSAAAAYDTSLEGAGADYRFGGVFVAAAGDRSSVRMRVAHEVADCRSESTVKGVASGDGRGRFEGLVYVARDAQRTDARQTSRNLLIGSESRIATLPQLEIYADDVKCSHGATVGQMDADAIMYMRQRGIAEAVARRLQVEGFVADVVMHCAVEEVGEALLEALQERMNLL